MSKQIQEQLQIRLKMLDDVFHNVIISLERLEIYLEKKRKSEVSTIQTGVNSDRDLHDDVLNPPTEEGFHLEIQTQCMALFFQTNFDKDKDTFDKVVKYFLNDLLTWYGGRNKNISPNAVEQYFIPIVSSLSRQISNVKEIDSIIKQYVINIDSSMENLSDEDKEKAVKEGFIAYTKAAEINRKRNEEFLKSSIEKSKSELPFTSHLRGSAKEGYRRLIISFLNLYTNKLPVKMTSNLVESNFDELKGEFENILLDEYYGMNKK